ncbi:MAG: alpha/beta hydrolase [Actinobacteria bacterium]|nr:alpha/beta hydrolase [Actinomycetota bacterium]
MPSNTAPVVPLDPSVRPPVDPGLQVVLDLVNRPDATPMSSMSPPEARAAFSMMNGLAGGPLAGVAVLDRTAPGSAGDLPVRVYTPEGVEPVGVVVWYHGGGWVIGDLDSHDDVCRRLSVAARSIVVAVDYRLAPEHPAPAAVHDAAAALAWVASHPDELGAEGLPVAVAGDSAGGNLAAVTAQGAGAVGPELAAQVLVYPTTDLYGDTDSKRTNGEGYFLTTDTMNWFRANYLSGGRVDAEDPLVSPLHADDAVVARVAPAFVLVAGYDPLRDEGIAYAKKLAAAGVPVELREYETMVHGFISMGALTKVTAEAIDDAARFLKARFVEAATS